MFAANKALAYSTHQFMHKVYAWMAIGLLLTAGTSYYLFSHPDLLVRLLASQYYVYGFILAQLGLVFYLSSRIQTMSYFAAAFGFSLYSLLMGITLAPIFLIYTMSSIGMVFVTTAGMFGLMAVYGYFTQTDLSRMGNILLMGLLGIILASLANMFIQSSQFEFILSIFGVLMFTAMTAYDVQKIKNLGAYLACHDDHDDATLDSRIAVLGALTLYLDFVNLFIYLLRLMGKRRE